MDWVLYISQLVNPLVGTSGAVPFAIGVLNLPIPGVAALVVPANVLQIAVVHFLWRTLLERPRVRAWLERRRNARVQGWLERRGVFLAAVLAAIILGAIPAYVSLRFLGVPFGRFATGIVVGCALLGAIVTGICGLAGL